MKLFKWLPKDNLDQPLHILVGFLITLIPVLIAKFYFNWDWLMGVVFVSIISYILSILTGAIREYYQHKRFVFNLDMFFWVIGSTVGVPFQWVVILIF